MLPSFENEIKSEFLSMSREMIQLLLETCKKLEITEQEETKKFFRRISKLRMASLASGYYEYTSILDILKKFSSKETIEKKDKDSLEFIFTYMLEINEKFSKDLSVHIDVRPVINQFKEKANLS